MSFTTLPNELILEVAEKLQPHELTCLIRTCRRFSRLLVPTLQKFALSEKYASIALFWAAALGNEQLVRQILTKGHSVPIIRMEHDGKELSMSHLTSNDSEKNELVSFALKQGPNLVLEDGDGRALYWATRHGYIDMISMLLDQGVDIQFKTFDGDTALHAAVVWQNLEATELLIAHGADVDARDGSGRTPLHLATVCNHVAIWETLADHGADLYAVDGYGKTISDKVLPRNGYCEEVANSFAWYSTYAKPSRPIVTSCHETGPV
ncbi:ankyrin repeat-containing domain protein [Tuber borchii]|uniref:Ankyrin repeat-containing domain protein n=1 Tax=Tuber borchii TaxID=42251 RepID=A0A2T6ZS95_TUBBO|nr:ankyrin repeat-containing domain protein [Tuber borchii]